MWPAALPQPDGLALAHRAAAPLLALALRTPRAPARPLAEPGVTHCDNEQTGGLTTKVVRAVGTAQQSTVSMVRDSSGNVTQRTDPDGQITQIAYNADGLPTHVTDPLERETTITYTAADDPETITDPVATTTMTYDSHGNLTSVSRPLTSTSSAATTTNAYDPDHLGDLISTTDANGKVAHYSYESAGNQVSKVNPEGDETTTAYNAIGWPTSTVSARGNTTGRDPAEYTGPRSSNALATGRASRAIPSSGCATTALQLGRRTSRSAGAASAGWGFPSAQGRQYLRSV